MTAVARADLPLVAGSLPDVAVTRLERAPVEPWHFVGGVGEPTLYSPYIARAGEPVRYRMTPDGQVEMVGAVDMAGAGSGSLRPVDGTILTLPAGYRPSRTMRSFAAYHWYSKPGTQEGDGFARVYVYTDGSVYLDGYNDVKGAVAIDLSGVRFYVRLERG